MSEITIVSYDGTTNDDDAVALGRVFAEAGARLILAYVRHNTNAYRANELEESAAEELLQRGVAALGEVPAETRTTVHGKTSEGLKQLAAEEGASLVVFGSEYRTAAGHVEPQKSTLAMLEGGPTAVAIAPAGYAYNGIRTIGLLAGVDDHAAIDTADALAKHFGATITDATHNVDLLIVGSRPEAPEGRAMISAQAEKAIENANTPVLVTARGVALKFRAVAAVA
jgi:nucleotide-binding universal stress UspA family protein